MCSGRILILLTSAQQLILQNGSMIDTGFHMSEFAEPVLALQKAGYEIVVATPDGNTPIPDPATFTILSEAVQQQYNGFLRSFIPVLLPLSFADINEEMLSTLDGLFIPGGYGPLAGLYNHPQLKKILKHMHKHQKPTAAICHGVLGLCYPLTDEEPWFYQNYKMTCYPKALDQAQEASVLGAALPFYMADVLVDLGAILVDELDETASLIQSDRELITARDESATALMIQAFLKQLSQFMLHRQLP